MKAKIEKSCVESRRAVAVVLDGGVHKNGKGHKGSGGRKQSNFGEENGEEMKEYLGKLKELVPFMPKNKRLSKLEVISHVIDYIHDLRETLGLPPCQTEMDCDMDNDSEDDAQQSREPSILSDSACTTNPTFKVSLVSSDSDSHGDSNRNTSTCPTLAAVSRIPLSSISAPRNTETISSDNSAN